MTHGQLRDLILLAQELSESSKGLTISEIMTFTQRSRRTVERMLASLEGLGIEPVQAQAEGDHHRLQRWRILEPLPAPLVALDEDERLALEGVAVTMPEGPARRALVKLLASQRSNVATGVAVDAHTLIDRTAYTGFVGPRYVGNEVLIGQLERAIQGFEEVELAYRTDGEAVASTRRVRPLGLLFGRFGYLVAQGVGERKPKSYRLNCIESVELTGQLFKPLARFSLKEWAAESFGIYHGDELRDWRIVFSPRVAERAEGVCFHTSERKRRFVVRASASSCMKCSTRTGLESGRYCFKLYCSESLLSEADGGTGSVDVEQPR